MLPGLLGRVSWLVAVAAPEASGHLGYRARPREKERPVEVRRPKQKLPQNPIEREKYLLLRCPSLLHDRLQTPLSKAFRYTLNRERGLLSYTDEVNSS